MSLKHCPFCGSADVGTYSEIKRVACNSCRSTAMSVEAWNQRSARPEEVARWVPVDFDETTQRLRDGLAIRVNTADWLVVGRCRDGRNIEFFKLENVPDVPYGSGMNKETQ